jgi:hypothetical protein
MHSNQWSQEQKPKKKRKNPQQGIETKLQRQEKGLHPGQGSLPGMFRCGLR